MRVSKLNLTFTGTRICIFFAVRPCTYTFNFLLVHIETALYSALYLQYHGLVLCKKIDIQNSKFDFRWFNSLYRFSQLCHWSFFKVRRGGVFKKKYTGGLAWPFMKKNKCFWIGGQGVFYPPPNMCNVCNSHQNHKSSSTAKKTTLITCSEQGMYVCTCSIRQEDALVLTRPGFAVFTVILLLFNLKRSEL